MSHEPRQASLRRLRRFHVRPNRELGPNFLIEIEATAAKVK